MFSNLNVNDLENTDARRVMFRRRGCRRSDLCTELAGSRSLRPLDSPKHSRAIRYIARLACDEILTPGQSAMHGRRFRLLRRSVRGGWFYLAYWTGNVVLR